MRETQSLTFIGIKKNLQYYLQQLLETPSHTSHDNLFYCQIEYGSNLIAQQDNTNTVHTKYYHNSIWCVCIWALVVE